MSRGGAATLEAPTAQREAEVPDTENASRRRFTIAAVIGLLVATIPYLWVLWDHRFDPLRTAWRNGTFSDFYDIQARALFHGHWDVPKGSLGIDAFVIGGKDYMYFGPFPSFLRMPILAVTDALDGQLTALSMLLAWVVTGLFSSLLLWRVRLLMRGPEVLGRAEAAAYAGLLATIMSGSVLLYIAGMPWVYHEAFSWSVAMGIGALFALLGVLERPSARRVAATSALTAAALLSRSTIGWGCVIAVILAAIWFAFGRGGVENRRWWLPLLAAGLIPLAVGCAINWVKFGTPFGLPMAAQVWTKFDAHRREVLAANDGSVFSPSFLPSTTRAYLHPLGLRLTLVFPFITLPSAPAAEVGGATLDVTYRTASLPTSMPLLFLLGIWGVVTAFRRRTVGRARLTCIPLFAATVATAGVLVAGYIANRYLAEFLPLLVLAAAVGVVDLFRRAAQRSQRVRRGALAAVAALGVFGLLANLAVASTPTDAVAWGGERARGYVELQKSISDITGHPLDRRVVHGERLPAWAPADQLFVVRNCAGLYISAGEGRTPWVAVDLRETRLHVTFHGTLSDAGAVPLVTVDNDPSATVSVEGRASDSIRFRVDQPGGAIPSIGKWTRVQLGRTYRVTLTPHEEVERILITLAGHELLSGWSAATGRLVVHPQFPQAGESQLLTVEEAPAREPTLCRRLAGPK
jgi:hypothetical protein